MEAIIDKAASEDVTIDAILAENDSTALGVVAALQAKGLDPIPLSGQDGDAGEPAERRCRLAVRGRLEEHQRARQGRWRGSRSQLCAGVPMDQLTIPDGLIADYVVPDAGTSVQDFATPGGNTVKSFILKVDAGHAGHAQPSAGSRLA